MQKPRISRSFLRQFVSRVCCATVTPFPKEIIWGRAVNPEVILPASVTTGKMVQRAAEALAGATLPPAHGKVGFLAWFKLAVDKGNTWRCKVMA
jgi:hypothetical protein